MPFDPTPSVFSDLDARVRALPRRDNRLQWQTALPLVVDLVRAIQPTRAGETLSYRAAALSSALGLSKQTLLRFAGGRRAGGDPWLELCEVLKPPSTPAGEPEPAPAAGPAAAVTAPESAAPVQPLARVLTMEETIAECVRQIASVPRHRRGFAWVTRPDAAAFVAVALLRSSDRARLRSSVAVKVGVRVEVLTYFASGHTSSGSGVWPELCTLIRAAGLEPLTVETWAERGARLAREQVAAHKAARAARVDPFPPRVAAPPSTPAPKAHLAVTQGGAVVEAKVPLAALAPSPMIAAGGSYAAKTVPMSTRKITQDPETGDFVVVVTTTTRIPYGSPEHLATSKARAATCAAKTSPAAAA